MRRAILPSFVVVALLALAFPGAPVLAGGWAAVRLDEAPGDVLVEVPWRFGFMVLQHDITPTSDVDPVVLARHKESGEEVRADARQEGAVGHFVSELIFPRVGDWKWSIAPNPFPETSLETLTVLAAPVPGGPAFAAAQAPEAIHPVHIHRGSCATRGEVAYRLTDLGPGLTMPSAAEAEPAAVPMGDPVGPASAIPVQASVGIVDASLRDLVDGGHAIDVDLNPRADKVGIVCGDLGGRLLQPAGMTERLMVGMREITDSGFAGVAVLEAAGERTTVTVYLLVGEVIPGPTTGVAPDAVAAAAPAAEIAIEASSFAPANLTVAAGTTVTWSNRDGIAHTVTGDALAFDDSGVLAPGQSFSQTFDTPGAFPYRCDPHPWMEGTITVE